LEARILLFVMGVKKQQTCLTGSCLVIHKLLQGSLRKTIKYVKQKSMNKTKITVVNDNFRGVNYTGKTIQIGDEFEADGFIFCNMYVCQQGKLIIHKDDVRSDSDGYLVVNSQKITLKRGGTMITILPSTVYQRVLVIEEYEDGTIIASSVDAAVAANAHNIPVTKIFYL
jgi:hypothetical protein